VKRLRVGAEQASADVVFTFELFDARGEGVGAASRHQSVPAWFRDAPDEAVVVGPVDIDVMGFVISTSPVSIPTPCAMGTCGHGADSACPRTASVATSERAAMTEQSHDTVTQGRHAPATERARTS